MKNALILAVAALLAGCAQLTSQSTDTNTSIRARMQSCMVLEAQNKLQAGTLFTNSLSATADELVSTCAQKLALQSLGVPQEAKSNAESIITNLQNIYNAQ